METGEDSCLLTVLLSWVTLQEKTKRLNKAGNMNPTHLNKQKSQSVIVRDLQTCSVCPGVFLCLFQLIPRFIFVHLLKLKLMNVNVHKGVILKTTRNNIIGIYDRAGQHFWIRNHAVTTSFAKYLCRVHAFKMSAGTRPKLFTASQRRTQEITENLWNSRWDLITLH